MAKRFKSPLFYPAKGNYFHCELISADPYLKIKTEDNEEIQTHLIGEYNFENVASALCIGKFFDVSPSKANAAVADYAPENMRSQIVKKGTNTIILDAYNANPSSMLVALRSLGKMQSGKKIAILGDMYELESESETEHKKIAHWISENNIEMGLLCGELIKVAMLPGVPLQYFSTKELLIEYLKLNPIGNATVLVKASRGMALESVVEYL
jgi:UDP-N-acetylmuramoyl-tripeptide--D-alanyl-D-alanine ligase